MRGRLLLLLPVIIFVLWALFSLPDDPSLPDAPPAAPSPEDLPGDPEAAASLEDRTPVVPNSKPSTASTFSLPRIRTIIGRVLDSETGEPIPTAVVVRAHVRGHRVRVSADGEYAIEVSGPGEVLRATARAYVPLTKSAGSGAEPCDFHLSRGATISGRVLDPQGLPVAGLRVSESRDLERFVLTGADGAYVFRGARTGYPTRLEARWKWHPPAKSRILTLKPGQVVEGVDIRWVPATRISGRVVPWPGASPGAARVSVTGVRGTTVNARPDGTFTLRVASRRPVELSAESPDGRVGKCIVRGLGGGGERTHVEIRMGAILSVRVVDHEGRVVKGVRLQVQSLGGPRGDRYDHVLPKPDGSLRQGLPRCEEWVISPFWSSTGSEAGRTIRVTATDEVVIIRLPRRSAISGRVTAGGEPVPAFSVFVAWAGGVTRHTGRAGTFRAENIGPGTLVVRVESTRGWAGPVKLELEAGEERADLAFELTAAPEIVCRVLDDAGRPVDGATVRLGALKWQDANGRTDENGRVLLRPSGPGPYVLSASAEGRRWARKPVPGGPEVPREVTVRLTREPEPPR